ncbi:MAG: acyl-CoA dehydrogenase family protein, partial [Chloroflexota bacterium]|nr:acyl-CoA dehydrogenase family protein [Chloroflexota bacterium]
MDFKWSQAQEEFRQEVRTFLDKELAEGTFVPVDDGWVVGHSAEFSRKLAAKGWIGLTWPKQYGGQGRSYLDRLILTEELLAYGAPVASHWLADRQVGPALIAYGSQEQKAEFLPRIVRADIFFCIGMSEPSAGSDLGSLQTRATQDGDDFIISGQKVWTSGAHEADYCYLVARTDPAVPKHRGISEFIVSMSLPDVRVRPVLDITGAHEFNEVFFDGVRVPGTCLIGERNRGWYQIAS